MIGYLATPYSKYPKDIHEAFKKAAEITAILIKHGYNIYSPIVHCHPVSIYGNIDPLNHELWITLQKDMMKVCDYLIVAKMQSWQHSKGIAIEIDNFKKQGKDIYYLDIRTFKFTQG